MAIVDVSGEFGVDFVLAFLEDGVDSCGVLPGVYDEYFAAVKNLDLLEVEKLQNNKGDGVLYE